MKIDDFKLNSGEKNALLSYSENDTFPQTLLIEGGSYDDRISLARLVANMLVCTADGEKPCGMCNACVKCLSGNHPDIKEFGEEKSGATFKVELSREIRQDAFVIPNDGDKKVFIIKESQNMNEASENALLKIFEEPPRFDYFVMTCQSRNAMLDTILSRATVISIGEHESDFSQEICESSERIAAAVCAESELEMLEALGYLSANKNEFTDISDCLIRIFMDSLEYKQTGVNNSSFQSIVGRICNKLTAQRIYALINAVNKTCESFNRNANYNLLITAMSANLRSAAGK